MTPSLICFRPNLNYYRRALRDNETIVMYDPIVKLGVELEVEILNNPTAGKQYASEYKVFGSYPKHQILSSTHKKHGNIVKIVDELCRGKITTNYDNTINDGFEWIGQPMGLKENIQLWDTLLANEGIAPYIHGEDVKESPGQWGTHDVGMHVHVSGDPITPLILGKLMSFINDQKNRSFIEYVAGRTLNRFCETQPNLKPTHAIALYHSDKCTKRSKRGSRIQHFLNGNYDCYTTGGLPCCKSASKLVATKFSRGAMWVLPAADTGEYEMRIFKSAVQPERFNSNLEFCVALIEFCHQVTVKELHFKNFGAWMSDVHQRVNYPSLLKFLRREGYAKGIIPSAPIRVWQHRSVA
jgi:hypothetical protein